MLSTTDSLPSSSSSSTSTPNPNPNLLTSGICQVPRSYQINLFQKALNENVIAVLGTGAGKTLISIMLIRYMHNAHKLHLEDLSKKGLPHPPKKMIVFLVNLVPLVFQQSKMINANTEEEIRVKHFCGEMGLDLFSEQEWKKIFNDSDVLVMTAQIFLNNLRHSFINLSQIELLIFDEAHHARKNNPYRLIIKEFYERMSEELRPKVFGMTASPLDIGDLEESLRCKAYFISEDDMDIKKYVPKPTEHVEFYDSPDFYAPSKILEEILTIAPNLSKTLLKRVVSSATSILDVLGPYGCDIFLYESIIGFTKKLRAGSVKFSEADRVEFINIATWIKGKEKQLAEPELNSKVLSPKVIKLVDILLTYQDHQEFCGIIFIEKRHHAYTLSDIIRRITKLKPFIECKCLLGHGEIGDQFGMDYKRQNKIINEFREGRVNLLVSTSVAEEGLNIQPCMLVIRFDPFNTLLSYIQSRGRARHRASKYVILLQKGNPSREFALLKMRKDEEEMIRHGQGNVKNMETGEMMLEEIINDFEDPGLLEDGMETMKEGEYYMVESTNAFVNLHSSIGLIFDYCSCLPKDIYCQLLPEFNFSMYTSGYTCELQMPPNSPFHSIVTEESFHSKQKAKQMVALQACVRLHELGELDEHLRPKKVIDEDFISKEEEEDEDPLLGTRRRRHMYDVGVPEAYGSLSLDDFEQNPDQTAECYCTLLLVKESNHPENHSRFFGLLSKKPLPKVPCFYVFVKSGVKTPVTPLTYPTPITLSGQQILSLAKFTLFLFTEIFNKEFKSTKFAYFLIPFLKEPNHLCSLDSCIDWKSVESLTSEKFNHQSLTPTDYEDRIMVDFTRFGARYYVEELCSSLNPSSSVINGTGNITTMEDFYVNIRKVNRQIDQNQPLIKVSKVGRVRNLLHPYIDKPDSKEEVAKMHYYYVLPQFCCFHSMRASVFKASMLLPGILMRFEALLLAQEFKGKMGIEVDDFVLLEALTTPVANMELNYQRLETLGDSFIKLSVTMYLYLHFHQKHEGQLSMMRSTIVSNKTLYKKALSVNLPGYVTGVPFARKRFSPPYFKTINKEGDPGGIVRTQVMADKPVADCVESTLGACYVSGGLDAALQCYIKFNMDFSPFTCWDDFCHAIPKYVNEYPDFMLPLMDFDSIESLIQYSFKDRRYLVEAFTHASAANVVTGCYQRLEFLGDAVLDFIVMRYFFTQYDDLSPGRLTDLKDAAVNNSTLAFIAVSFGLHAHIIHSSDALLGAVADFIETIENMNFHEQFWLDFCPPKVISDVVESLIGAVWIDCKFDINVVYRVFELLILPFIERFLDPKTIGTPPVKALMEMCHRRKCEGMELIKIPTPPEMELMDARQTFIVQLHGTLIAKGVGVNRRFAKRFAAINAIEVLKQDPTLIKRLCVCEQFGDDLNDTDCDSDEETMQMPQAQ